MKIKNISLASLSPSGMKSLAATLAALLFAILAPNIARAQSCQPMLQNHADWANKKSEGLGSYSLSFVLVSNMLRSSLGQQGPQIATYAEGDLTLTSGSLGPIFTGAGKQYFNDRRWGFPAVDVELPLKEYPFDPKKIDDLKLLIFIGTGTALLTKPGANWSDAVELKCENGVMYGFGKPHSSNLTFGRPMYVITLKRRFSAYPK